MNEEDLNLLQKYTLEFLNKNNLILHNSFYSNRYRYDFIKNKNKESKVKDYEIKYFLEDIVLGEELSLNFISYVDSKNGKLAYDLIKKFLKIPKSSYEKSNYMRLLIDKYTHNLKYKNNLKNLFAIKKVLNQCPDIIYEYFQKGILLEEEKKMILEYYKNEFQKKNLFKENLEFQRIVFSMNKCLKKPLDFIFFEEKKELKYEIKEAKAILLQIDVKDIMQRYTDLSNEKVVYALRLLDTIQDRPEFQIEKIMKDGKNNQIFTYLIMTQKNKDFFQKFIDFYIEDMLSSLKIAKKEYLETNSFNELITNCFLKTQMEQLENNLEKKEIFEKVKKI